MTFAGIPAGRLPLGVRFCRWSLRMNSPHLVPGTEGGLPALRRIGAGALAAGRSDEYRRYVKECLDMANAVQDAKSRASLLQMAQVWLRLAQQHNAEQRPDNQPNG